MRPSHLILVRSSHSAAMRSVESGKMGSYCSRGFVEQDSETLTSSDNASGNQLVKDTTPYGDSQQSRPGGTYYDFQSNSLQHWFKNWQQKRIHKLTASTFAGVIGFWPRRRVQLWLEKIGAVEPFFGNVATFWSNIKEEEALERYMLITGHTVIFPEFQTCQTNNSEDDWLAASPDGIAEKYFHDLPSRGVLEIKCPFFQGDMNLAFPWKRIPIHYIPQAQGLMEILDRDWMDFYVWTPNGSSLFRLYRDVEYWDVMKIALSDFWWNNVQPAREIYNTTRIIDPHIELRDFRPEPRHELFQHIIQATRRVIDNNSELLVREINGRGQL